MSSQVPQTPAGAMSSSPPERIEERQGLVVVAKYTHPIEAEVARANLEAHGISALVIDDNTVAMMGLLSQAVGLVKLLVEREDLESARMLLGNPATSEETAEAGPAEEIARPSEADDLALKAWRAAVLGFAFPVFLHLYSVRLLILFVTSPEKASFGSWVRAAASLVIDVAVIAGVFVIVRSG